MSSSTETVKLTELASCGGCAAKYSAARLEELMLVQQENAFAQNRSRQGEVVAALVDRVEEDGAGGARLVARSGGEAPEIDPVIVVETGAPAGGGAEAERRGRKRREDSPAAFRELAVLRGQAAASGIPERAAPGDFLALEVSGSRGYDLLARPAATAAAALRGGREL